MAKPGYQFDIFDEISADHRKQYKEAIRKLETEYAKKITSKERDIEALKRYDPDDMDAETRRDIRIECSELEDIKHERDRKLAELREQYHDVSETR